MKFLHKVAANIVVEPYEAIIEKGIKLVEAVKGSSFFSGVAKIIVEHNMDHHYGRVFSDEPNTIYISGPRIKTEFGADPVEQIYQIASTLIHEMAHIKDKMKNGEGPSEAAETQFLNDVKVKLEADPEFLKKFADKKIQSLFKTAKPEPSGVFSDEGQIIVTTAARIVFRKNNSAWAKITNKVLNPFIAEAYKNAPFVKVFKDKNGSDKGEIRGDKSNSMIGIIRGKTIAIVHVKGQFSIPNPPDLTKSASRNTALEAERGWLAEHFLDLFSGQFALDEDSQKRLRDYLNKGNEVSKLAKMNSNQLSQFAASFMAENFNNGTTRDPAHMTEGSGMMNFPNAFPKAD